MSQITRRTLLKSLAGAVFAVSVNMRLSSEAVIPEQEEGDAVFTVGGTAPHCQVWQSPDSYVDPNQPIFAYRNPNETTA